MSTPPADLRGMLLQMLSPKLRRAKLKPEQISDDFHLLNTGLLDSFGLVETISSIQQQLDSDIDFSRFDPAEFQTFGGLIRCIEISLRGE
jgi:acyl carrier protein